MRNFIVAIVIAILPLSALAQNGPKSGITGLGGGIGFGFTEIEQEIPGTGANLEGTALQFTYVNLSYFAILTNSLALSIHGYMGTELFRVDGALGVPDKDVTVYDGTAELRWPMGGGSWTSPKSLAPVWIVGMSMNGLPVLGMPPRPGALYTIERLNTISPIIGVGTGVYFSSSNLHASVRMGIPFTGDSKFHVNSGVGLVTQFGYNFVLGSVGNVGLDIWGKRAHVDFDAVDPITNGEFNNKYLFSTWGLKFFYRLVF